MIRTGRVVESAKGQLKVCFDRPEMCESCGACAGHAAHKELITVEGEGSVGDVAAVEMPDAKIVKVSLIAYIIPLVGLMLGLLIGQTLTGTDLWAALLGVAGLALGLLIVRLADRRLGRRAEWTPKLIAVSRPKEEASLPNSEG
ncbi:MAG: SoxR reducing system RseC family protein [Clostridia bacterium]|nr:SoxR reducing system RseC family protein [Clostridia bacterium]